MARVELGLDRLGAEPVNDVADLELGLPQDLMVGLGGQEAGHLEEIGLEGLGEDLGQFLSVGLLLGGQLGGAHWGLLVNKRSVKSR